MVMVMMVVIVNPFLLNRPVLDLISSETDVLSIIMSYHGTYHKPILYVLDIYSLIMVCPGEWATEVINGDVSIPSGTVPWGA